MPEKNCLIKLFLSLLLIGLRSHLIAISLAVGAGIFSSKKTNNSSGNIKIKPVAKGNQNSETCHCNCIYLATDFTKPEENIKLTASAAPIKSVAFLPSIYENTIPHVIPNGKPLKKRKIILYGAGTMAKRKSDTQDIPIKMSSSFHLPTFFNSAINFIP